MKNVATNRAERVGTSIGFAIGNTLLPGLCFLPIICIFLLFRYSWLREIFVYPLVLIELFVSVWVGRLSFLSFMRDTEGTNEENEFAESVLRSKPTRSFIASSFLSIGMMLFFLLIPSHRMADAIERDFPEGVIITSLRWFDRFTSP